jgi:two-component system sensor kinase FixL
MTMPTRRQGATTSWTAGDDRLRLLLDGMRDLAVVMIGPQGMVLTWNSGAARIFGHLPEEIIGQQMSSFYPPAAVGAGAPQAHLGHALEQGRFEEEAWRVRNDGSRFWASVGITPLHDRSGRLRGFGQVVRDLSDRLRANDLLAVLDAASDAVLGVDGDGRVLFLNAAASRLFGYPPGELAGRPVELLVPVDLRARHAHWRSGGAAGEGGHDHAPTGGDRVQLEARRCDGTTFPAEVVLRSVTTPRGRVVSVTVRDLSPLHVVRPPGTGGVAGVPVQLPPDPAHAPRPGADVRDLS